MAKFKNLTGITQIVYNNIMERIRFAPYEVKDVDGIDEVPGTLARLGGEAPPPPVKPPVAPVEPPTADAPAPENEAVEEAAPEEAEPSKGKKGKGGNK